MFGSLEDTFEEAKTSWYSGAFHVTALGAGPFVTVNVVAILKGYSGCFTIEPLSYHSDRKVHAGGL